MSDYDTINSGLEKRVVSETKRIKRMRKKLEDRYKPNWGFNLQVIGFLKELSQQQGIKEYAKFFSYLGLCQSGLLVYEGHSEKEGGRYGSIVHVYVGYDLQSKKETYLSVLKHAYAGDYFHTPPEKYGRVSFSDNGRAYAPAKGGSGPRYDFYFSDYLGGKTEKKFELFKKKVLINVNEIITEQLTESIVKKMIQANLGIYDSHRTIK